MVSIASAAAAAAVTCVIVCIDHCCSKSFQVAVHWSDNACQPDKCDVIPNLLVHLFGVNRFEAADALVVLSIVLLLLVVFALL